mmetsp:Transcript_24756/g.56970  ORF Transcript_24756/g.56970 Transcript_24756/m.56970 type:complete len:123 (+) Transcript_24756:1494-1862(+)
MHGLRFSSRCGEMSSVPFPFGPLPHNGMGEVAYGNDYENDFENDFGNDFGNISDNHKSRHFLFWIQRGLCLSVYGLYWGGNGENVGGDFHGRDWAENSKIWMWNLWAERHQLHDDEICIMAR